MDISNNNMYINNDISMDINNDISMDINNSIYNYRRYFDDGYNNRLNNYNTIINILSNFYNEMAVGDIENESLYEEDKYIKVIDELEKTKLKSIKYNKDEHKDITRCPITYKILKDGDDMIELPCNHMFTKDGIEKWLYEKSNVCPICRYEFKYKIKKNESIDNNIGDEFNSIQLSLLNTLNNINLDD